MASVSTTTPKADDNGKVAPADSSDDGTTKTGDSVKSKDTDDPELYALLDSALADFDSQPKHSQPLLAQTTEKEKKKPSQMEPAIEVSPQQEALFNELFHREGSEDAVLELEETMKRLLQQGPPQGQQTSQGTGQSGGDASCGQQEFAAALAQALSGMAQNAEGLKEPMSEEEMLRSLSGLGLGGAAGDDTDFMPMMQDMMKNLLSKEVLYPSLKEISEKYPKWLEENKEKTDPKEFENYQKQYMLMSHICTQFEADDSSDPESVQNERFEKILDLMQQMQELGHPPKDIVGEMAPGLEFDENGVPKLPTPEQCCVM
ncbi:peroxisomal biogenesis factor 19-like isoform X2 [Liolophura sinensis]|uniref:peroxisomal biogenesis factor 19-like isoform X2 n=1 Tax=Liolophura sinensis TaxID=3198878 RepID=UPI0031593264